MENQEKEPLISEEVESLLPKDAQNLITTEGHYLMTEISSIKVTNAETYKKAVELGIRNKKILTQIESFRKAIVQPFNNQIKQVNSMFKALASRFDSNDEKLRKALLSYQEGRKKTESIQNVNVESAGRATIVERRDWELADEKLVPDKYWILDEITIGKVIRAGGEIPGIKVVIKKTTAFVAE